MIQNRKGHISLKILHIELNFIYFVDRFGLRGLWILHELVLHFDFHHWVRMWLFRPISRLSCMPSYSQTKKTAQVTEKENKGLSALPPKIGPIWCRIGLALEVDRRHARLFFLLTNKEISVMFYACTHIRLSSNKWEWYVGNQGFRSNECYSVEYACHWLSWQPGLEILAEFTPPSQKLSFVKRWCGHHVPSFHNVCTGLEKSQLVSPENLSLARFNGTHSGA